MVIERTSCESQTTFIDFRRPHLPSFSFSWSLYIIINCNGHMQYYVLYVKSLNGIIGGVLPLPGSWWQVHGSGCQNIVLVYLSIPSRFFYTCTVLLPLFLGDTHSLIQSLLPPTSLIQQLFWFPKEPSWIGFLFAQLRLASAQYHVSHTLILQLLQSCLWFLLWWPLPLFFPQPLLWLHPGKVGV